MTGLGISGGPQLPEIRESYTSQIISALATATSTNSAGSAAAHGIVEGAVAWWGRGMQLARVSPVNRRTAVLTPQLLGQLARELGITGNALYVLDVAGGRLHLDPACDWTVYGSSPRPSTWFYDANLSGPTGTTMLRRPAQGVAHIRYQWSPRAPWRGLSPLQGAATTARLLGGLEKQFGDEASAASGYLVGVPNLGDKGRGKTTPSPWIPCRHSPPT